MCGSNESASQLRSLNEAGAETRSSGQRRRVLASDWCCRSTIGGAPFFVRCQYFCPSLTHVRGKQHLA